MCPIGALPVGCGLLSLVTGAPSEGGARQESDERVRGEAALASPDGLASAAATYAMATRSAS